jgi:hypothetical protein
MAIAQLASPDRTFSAPIYRKFGQDATQEASPSPLRPCIGMAGDPGSLSVCLGEQKTRTLFAPPKVADYMCLELVDSFSQTVRDIVDMISKILRTSYDELKHFMEEKVELLKDLLAKSQEASATAYYQDIASYALTAFNFILGAFLMDSSAAEAAVPAMCFMAAATLSAAGLVMKEASGWHFIAELCSNGDKELEEKIKMYAPQAMIGMSSLMTVCAGSVTALNASLFTDLVISKDTALALETGVGATTSLSTAAGAVAKSREGFAKAGLATIQDKITMGSFRQDGLTTFASNIKGYLDTCYNTLKQIIQNSINRSVS